MLQINNISSEDIAHAERLILPPGSKFDPERRAFIRNFNTLDLQAVPGSGKTTVLLAKLLVLAKKIDHSSQGILVISHTNIAVNQIKQKIGKYCPQLFEYPNFIGTIQSFVDKYLTRPYYERQYGAKISRIDSQLYYDSFFRIFPPQYQPSLASNCYNLNTVLEECVVESDILVDYFSRNTKKFKFNSNTKTYSHIVNVKKKLTSLGILNFKEAYYLGFRYIEALPIIKNILQRRFCFVFVDEFQDMEKHQYDILERIFYDNGNSSSIYQRIGDKNQAIFDGTSSIDEVWQYRPTVITINGSQRLPNLIANVVDRFAINRTADFSVRGLRETDIKPHILRYSQRSIGNVIPFFMKRIEELIAQPENASFREKVKAIDANGVYQYPIGIMGWGTGVGRESEEAEDKIHICDYFPTYSRISKSVSTDSNILSDYFMLAEKSERHLGQIINRIMNAIVRILRLEKINTPDGKYYTTTKLINLLRCVDLVYWFSGKRNLADKK